ncbi:LysR substrate-binding domain-containing protein [Paraburkholderia phytofirmans]|jgi:DNA-binding transcriptional LysR family regulator|uniref:LysR family transcriptional regulator n=1 Tax=Paraburkholderia phytofirmans TaxID=261302 RepID=UPI0038BB561A
MDTLESMRVFARVATDGGFSAAGRQMNMSTGQISRAVSHLEMRLSTRLLNRTTRKIALTEAGERYLDHCQKILSHIERAEAEASDARTSPGGTLKIHSMSSFGQHHIVPTLLRFRARYPSVKIDLTFSQSVPHLLDEGYDASIMLAPELPDSGLIAHRLGTVVGVVCASPAYIRKHGTPLKPEELQRHTCVQLTNPVFPNGKWMFEGTDGPVTVTPGPSVFSVNLSDALELVIRQGSGIGLLPAASALPGLRSGELVRVLPRFELQPLNVYALYLSRQYIDAKIRSWLDFVREDMPPALEADIAALQAVTDRQLVTN